MIRYELHYPINEREAKKRKLPKDIAILLVQITDRKNVEERLSEFIHKARKNSQYMIAQSMTMFMSSRKLNEMLKSKGLRYRFDNDINSKIRRPQNVIIDCTNRDDIGYVLKEVDTEALVFYGEAEVTNNPDIQEQLVEAGRDGYIESGFLKLINDIPIFIFYSSTHDSIEIFGKPESVKSLFLTYCESGKI